MEEEDYITVDCGYNGARGNCKSAMVLIRKMTSRNGRMNMNSSPERQISGKKWHNEVNCYYRNDIPAIILLHSSLRLRFVGRKVMHLALLSQRQLCVSSI
ncbi:hypothetical protein RchiOBHm_Chr2g0137991 [Rosa chinensis]|uniref:Uncharacterized protein n=1 Tax=Rosa chinensis TaxID=74649 RepID=A0A2P6RWQ7_ROSCH|nr:hypothetical protein RchiOBHm_Chr2g0137991 [Rosa chinensis]